VSLNSRAGILHGDAFDVLDWLRKPIDAGRLLNALGQLRRHDTPRILHVEDDADVRHIMSAILGDSARITPASNLTEARAQLALAKSTGQPFDLAILDVGLPDGSGLDLLPMLSSSEPPANPRLKKPRLSTLRSSNPALPMKCSKIPSSDCCKSNSNPAMCDSVSLDLVLCLSE
jgi:CheY-like chemotaxis protein